MAQRSRSHVARPRVTAISRLLAGLLQRIGGWVRDYARRIAAALKRWATPPRAPRNFQFEPLEARVLLSADLLCGGVLLPGGPPPVVAPADDCKHVDIDFPSDEAALAVAQHVIDAASPALTLTDADGTRFTLALTGPGKVAIIQDATSYRVHVSGSSINTELSMVAEGGDGRVSMTGITVSGSIKSMSLPAADLNGTLDIHGSTRSLSLASASNGTIRSCGNGTFDLQAGVLNAVKLITTQFIGRLQLAAWNGTGSSLQAAGITELDVSTDMAADIALSGIGASITVANTLRISGASTGLWQIAGRVGSIELGSSTVGWRANIQSGVTELSVQGNASGLFAAASLDNLVVKGNTSGLSVLIGADLGSDAAPGGAAAAADTFQPGTLRTIHIVGNVSNTVILAGVHPTNATFGDGDDVLRGTSENGVRVLYVGGSIDAASHVIATGFPDSVVVGGIATAAAAVPQLATRALDWIAPTLSARLNQDTGIAANDGLTNTAAMTGTVSADTVRLSAILDRRSGAEAAVDVSASLRPDGTFTLSHQQLALIAGGVLAEGAHTVRLFTSDAAGNQSNFVDIAFTLDTTAPNIGTLTFAAADASNAAGTETSSARALLKGLTEAGATVTLSGQGITSVAGAGGTFILPNTLFELGSNTVNLSAIDAAGNTATFTTTLSRVAQQQRDPVLTWNDIALAAIELDVSDPAIATRVLAIQSVAVYDTLAAIEGTPAYLVKRTATGVTSPEAAVTEAAYQVLYALYPGQRASFDAARAASLARIPDGAAKTAGIELGKSIAQSVLAIRAADGYLDFVLEAGSDAIGKWRPAGPVFLASQAAHWGSVTPFALASGSQFRPAAPPALDSAAYASALDEVRSLGGATSTARTADQTQQVHFWADGGGSPTPPGHWNQIATQVAAAQGNSLSANARLMAQLNIALADAAIASWDTKYSYDGWRPVTAIHEAGRDGNALTAADVAWQPLLITPPHPEYVSGHSTFSAAAAGILAATFGDTTSFSTTSATLPGVTRNFTSFSAAVEEAGRSRIYGGIHFDFSNQVGQALGKQVAGAVLARFALSDDRQAPTVVLGQSAAATRANLTLSGQVLDNLSGAASAEVRIDGGAPVALAFDAEGKFAITTAFALDGSADGEHTITVIARDAAGNLSSGYTRRITLDTKAPTISLATLADGILAAGSALAGSASATGSALVSLRYSIDGGVSIPVSYDEATGSFNQPIALGNLAVGDHVLTLRAQDSAGNVATSVHNVRQPVLSPFTLTRVTPFMEEIEVGVTYRPQVFFSRAVDPATLTAESFYATGPDGERLPATIVPALDGSYAWLFFTNPLPGSSKITLHLDGAAVRAQSDDARLSINTDGVERTAIDWSFSTVSTTSVAGARLVGKVVDPGADLEPMTFDDMRRGPDGIIHTADDVFLNPIANARVFVIGRPDLTTFTDANGNFAFDSVPVGEIKVGIDGRTATNAPAGVFFPEMVIALQTRPGTTNTMMDSMGTAESRAANLGRAEVFLPRVQSSSLQAVAAGAATTITVGDRSAPELTDQQRGQLFLTVAPGSAVGEDGKVLADVKLGINTVPVALIKDMLPPGMSDMVFNITIQAPGVSTFTEPLAITFPNVFNALPGTKLDILSFDHTTGLMVISAQGTVSADGLSVTSDPGTGIMAPGWHTMAGPGNCPANSAPQKPPRSTPPQTLPPQTFALTKKADGSDFSFNGITWSAPGGGFSNPLANNSDCGPSPGKAGKASLQVTIDVSGPLDVFMSKKGDVNLRSNSFVLRAGSGETRTLDFKPSKLDLKVLNENLLFASTIKITTKETSESGEVTTKIQTLFVTRFVDATDDKHDDGTVEFTDVVNDGEGGAKREIGLRVMVDDAEKPRFAVFGDGFSHNDSTSKLGFDPNRQGNSIGTLTIRNPDGGGVAGTVALKGKSTAPQGLIFDEQDFIRGLQRLVAKGPTEKTTASELALFDTYEKQLSIARQISNIMPSYFAAVAPGVSFTRTGPLESVVNTDSSAKGPVFLGYAVGGLKDYGAIVKLLKDREDYSIAELGFRLDQTNAINPDSIVELFLDNIFNGAKMENAGQIVKFISDVLAHEFAHQLDIVHSSRKGDEVEVKSAKGSSDLMKAGYYQGQKFVFGPVVLPAMRMATNVNYSPSDVEDAISYYTQHQSKGINLTDEHELEEEAEAAPPISGPALLAQRVSDGKVLMGELDFGNGTVDGQSGEVKLVPVQLSNVGTEPLVLEHVQVMGAGFSLSGVKPGQILAPGANVVVQLAFDPLVTGTAKGKLTIRSNDEDGLTGLVLSGFGQSATAHATIVTANNNFGGADTAAGEIKTKTFTIRNDGAQPLVISALNVVRGASDFSLVGAASALANGPVTLAFGESFDFDVAFAPATLGLSRGTVAVTTNDPANAVLDVALVGTAYSGTHDFAWGDDYVAVENDGKILRAQSASDGRFGVSLRWNTAYHTTVFDPFSGMVAHGHGKTAPNGGRIDLTSGLVFAPSTAPDSDGDGLPDDIELAIGSSPASKDSNTDGVDDFVAVKMGKNWSDPVDTPNWVESATALSGSALALTVAAGPRADEMTAYVATGQAGLAVIDISRSNRPVILAQLDLPGLNADIAHDAANQAVVLAAGSAGIHIVDTSVAGAPVLRTTLALEAPVTAVRIQDGLAYVAAGTQIAVVDVESGLLRSVHYTSGAPFAGLAIDGDMLYATDGSGTLHSLRITGTSLAAIGQIRTGTGAGRLTVAAGIAYLVHTNVNSTLPGGYTAIDVSDPAKPVVLAASAALPSRTRAVAVNGAGLAIAVGDGNQATLDVYRNADPRAGAGMAGRIVLPAGARDVVIAAGRAIVANGDNGLVVARYGISDRGAVAPTVTLELNRSDLDAAEPGIQLTEGAPYRAIVAVADDVQVSRVELMIDGQVKHSDVTYPFAFPDMVAPAAGTRQILQVRATDSGGNTTLSAPITLVGVADRAGPRLVSSSLLEASTVTSLSRIDMTFDEAIDMTKLTASDVMLTHAGADALPGTADDLRIAVSVHSEDDGRRLVVSLTEPLKSGQFSFSIDAAKLSDRAGNASTSSILRNFSVAALPHFRAASGTPANPALPSANPGAEFGVQTGFDPSTARARFFILDANGNRMVSEIAAARFDAAAGVAYFVVPLNASTGAVTIFSSRAEVTRTTMLDLQIVPVLRAVQASAMSGAELMLTFSGDGIAKGEDAVYRIGSANGSAAPGTTTVRVAASDAVTGPITVSTAGGTSAPFVVPAFSIDSVAFSGVPASVNQASANPGQRITLRGSNLTAQSQVLMRWMDSAGTLQVSVLQPERVAGNGASATLVVPDNANGAFALQILGAPDSPVLQIVPRLLAYEDSGANVLSGAGLVEGASTYRFTGVTLTDLDKAGSADVYYDNSSVSLGSAALPFHGAGAVTVTTAGGTSEALHLGQTRIQLGGNTLGDLAIDPRSGALWVTDTELPSRLFRIDPVSGAALQSLTLPNKGGWLDIFGATNGMQVLGQAMTLGSTNVPAGSILLFDGNANPNRVLAIDPAGGTVLATLALAGGENIDAGLYDPDSGHLFATETRGNTSVLLEFDPASGALLGTFALPPDARFARGLARDPVSHNFWFASSAGEPAVIEISRAGVEIRRVDISSQGIHMANITSLAFNAEGSMIVASTSGKLFEVVLDRDTVATPTPTLAAVLATAANGVPADGTQASANVGDVIELRGTSFGTGTSVLFATRDNQGRTGTVTVLPSGISADGTRLQVRVPGLAASGEVRVVNRGNNHPDLSLNNNMANYSVYRQRSVSFTAGAATATIHFANGAPDFGTAEKSWGLDNVTVKQGATTVFADNFEQGAASGWSNTSVDSSERALFTSFSGSFGSANGQTLTLGDLVAGQTYTLAFDLYQLPDARNAGDAIFDVSVDGASVLRDTISPWYGDNQTLNASTGLRLQIVPTITLSKLSQSDGAGGIYLQGSGFINGATTVTVAGQLLNEQLLVGGEQNDKLAIYDLVTLDGPIRVTTDGGYAEVASAAAVPSSNVLTGITASATAGLPANPASPSALTGQTITLHGHNFTHDTVVLFSAADATGATGTVSRRGDVSANGTSLTVSVPALARSGPVTLAGNAAAIALQIVPSLRAIGGTLQPGNTIMLEGSGLSAPDLAIQIDGQTVSGWTRHTVFDGTDTSGPDQQMITLVVPAGVSAGLVTVTSAGGQASLAPARLSGIVAQAASGVPAQAGMPSANTGQTIVLRGNALATDDKVVFTTGGQSVLAVTPLAIDLAAQTITIVVPDNAISGAVRLARDTAGMILQIVPTISVLEAPDALNGDNGVTLRGSGFAPAGLAVTAGHSTLPNVWLDANSTLYIDTVAGAASGPIRVTTFGGTSAAAAAGLNAIAGSAMSGLPAKAGVASANPGQSVTIAGSTLTMQSGVLFEVTDSAGQRASVIVRPSAVRADGSSAEVKVPLAAITGVVRVLGSDTALPLQIVPTVDAVKILSVAADGRSAVVLLEGSGFVEGAFSQYRFGNTHQVDSGPGGGANVGAHTSATSGYFPNGGVAVTVPLVDGAFGPLSVTTAGGTSAPFIASLAGISAVAASGVPADLAQASANPGQTVTLQGAGLTAASTVLLRWVDVAGVEKLSILTPSSAAPDGSSATVTVPTHANGAFRLQLFGSATQPMLQIVPTLASLATDTSFFSADRTRLAGSGLVEGASTFRFAGNVSTGSADVSNANRGALIEGAALPHHGAGLVTVTTAGGTSAGLAWNRMRVNAPASGFGDMAIDPVSGALWVSDTASPGHLLRVERASGAVVQSIVVNATDFGSTHLGAQAGLQILAQPVTLGNTSVPAGSLLVFNGQASVDRVVAINPATGALVASLALAGNYNINAGVFDPVSGHLFVTESAGSANRMLEIDPATGALLKAVTLPVSVAGSAALALDPVSGNLWLASEAAGAVLIEISRAGTELRRVAIASQGVSGPISGLAFAADGTLLVSTRSSLIIFHLTV